MGYILKPGQPQLNIAMKFNSADSVINKWYILSDVYLTLMFVSSFL